MENIKRRQAIKRAAWIMGGVLSAPTIAGIMNGCTPKPELTWTPSFFTEDQARTIMEMAETILPETDTPGAKKLGVPGFIEEMVSMIYQEEAKNKFMSGLNDIMLECKQNTGDDFWELSAEDRFKFLNEKNDEIRGLKFLNGDTSERKFFWKLKELVLAGYYTTEYGATQALQYVAIPAEQHGCMPLREVGNGKTWATS